MRRIAIIGSGLAGLVLAHGLLRAGFEVELYSDRTAQQWLTESRPTGTAVRFPLALSHEQALGLDLWDEVAPPSPGVNFVLCMTPGIPLLVMNGRMGGPALAVDVRLQSSRWLELFEERGGTLHIEKVSLARLDEIASGHDLTVVASGKGALSDLFPVDVERSVYRTPQRHLAMVNVTNLNDGRDVRHAPARYYELPTAGETVWTPYYHMTLGASWNLFSEARAGSPLDRFRGATSGEEVLARFKQLIREVYPWDWEWAKDMTLADPNGWLVGEITPTIRQPVGTLPSGRCVTFVGDAGMAFDPIGAQGANNGVKMARHLVQVMVKQGEAAFDAAWMQRTFDAFYHDEGEPAYRFNNLLLEGMPPGGQEMLAAQYGSDGRRVNRGAKQRIANLICSNFSDPRTLTDTLSDVQQAREAIRQETGAAPLRAVLGGRAAVIRDQLRWRMGRVRGFGFQHLAWRE